VIAAHAASFPLLDPDLFNQTIFFLHRMVDSLGQSVLPELPAIMLLLLQRVQQGGLESLAKYMLFVNQVHMKFRGEAYPITNALFLPILQTLHGAMDPQVEANPVGAVAVKTEIERETADLKRFYYDFVYCLLSHGLHAVLVTPEHTPHLERILEACLDGAVNGSALETQKCCLNSLKCVVELWGTQEPFTNLVYTRIFPVMFEVIFAPSFDIETGDSRLILGAVSTLTVAIATKLGPPATQVLAEKILPALGIPPANAQEVATQLCATAELPLRKYLKGLVKELRAARGGKR